MKKRILSCLMALALCLTLLPATAQAAEPHTHCLCGATHNSDITTTHGASDLTIFAKQLKSNSGNWNLYTNDPTKFNGSENLTGKEGQWLLPAGCYYLDEKVWTSKTIRIQDNVTICLNGYEIEKASDAIGPVFEVPTNCVLTLTNCKGTGKVTRDNSSNGIGSGVYVNGGTLNLYEGQITGNNGQEQGENKDCYGGGVCFSSGTFKMYGGKITDNGADYGGGVYVGSGTFTMNGGTITANNRNPSATGGGVYVSNNGTFIMNNTASVTENEIGYGSTGGAGVYVNGGTFEMHNDASVATNKVKNSGSCGAGVYVNSGGTFKMHNDASVTGNIATSRSATLNGAGVYVTGRDTTFTMHNSSKVTKNTASGTGLGDNDNGGGVYVSVSGKDGKFEMNGSASVTGNKATGYGGGVYMEKGTFTMNKSASVTSNQAYNGGGVFVSGGTFAMNGEATSVSNNKATQYGGVFVSNQATFTVSDKPTVTGNTKIGADGAASNVNLAGSAKITIAAYGLHGNANSIGVTKAIPTPVAIATGVNEDCSGKFFSDDNTREVKYDETENKLVLKNKETQPPTHEHKWTYTANNATITAACTNTTGVCDVNNNGGSVTITVPTEDLTYNGMEKPAMVKGLGNWKSAFSENISITYEEKKGDAYKSMEGVPKNVGKYKASITVGNQTAFVEYEITKKQQDPLILKSTERTLAVGKTLTLLVDGGSTSGAVTYRITSGTDNAELKDNVLTAKKAGKVTVTATMAGNETYNDVTSGALTITITEKTGGGTTPSQPGGSTGGNTGGSSSGSSSSGSYDSNPIIKTETKNNADGSTTKTETRKDGTVTATTTAKDGSTSKTETKKDGSSVTENKAADGSTGTVKTDKNGQTEAAAKVSAKAVEAAKKSGEAVKAPVEVKASHDSGTAPTVKVELPQNSGKTEAEIPVSNAKPGTVAVLVHPDGTEEILKASAPTENGIRLTVDGSATVKIVDNAKGFIDTQNHWAKDEIDFVSARELVNGISATRYAPDATATRAQLWTILARQNDADLSGGANWYEKAQLWSKDKGISDGTQPDAAITRAQMVTMLWRTMGQPAAGGAANFNDVPANSYYAQAVAWAVESGITTGVGNGRFDPNSTCTRAQIAAFLARSMK